MKHSRRTVLASLGTAALCGLAGCSSLPGFDDEEQEDGAVASPRNWMFDPTRYTEEAVAGFLQFESPAALFELDDHLHPEALESRPASLDAHTLDWESVEWAMQYAENLFRTPLLRAFAGSFGTGAAKAATAAVFDVDPEEGTERDPLGGYEVTRYGEDQYGLARGGEAVCISVVEHEETVSELVEQRDESSPGLGDASQELLRLLETVGLDTAASVSFQIDEDEERVRGHGFGYTADGATTTVRYAVLNGDRPSEDLEELEEIIDALTDVTVEEDGGIRWLEGSVETSRIAFDGSMFNLLRAPYE